MHGALYMYAIFAFCSCAQGPIAMGPNQKGERGREGRREREREREGKRGGWEREGREIVVVFSISN